VVAKAGKNGSKMLWCQTTDEGAILSALEQGVRTFLFDDRGEGGSTETEAWLRALEKRALQGGESESRGAARALFRAGDGAAGAAGGAAVVDARGGLVASFHELREPEDTARLSRSIQSAGGGATFVVSFEGPSTSDPSAADADGGGIWKIIPAENLIAAKGMHGSKLLTVVQSTREAETMLSVLEAGTDGVVLQSDDSGEFAQAAAFLASGEKREDLVEATVDAIVFEGMGDRACVDLCINLQPGEGMLCGSFSKGLALVHSECEETDYINSRPFRVNAGPVHSYVKMPGDRTAYLSELKAGDQVLVVNPQGETRTATVGRMKIEYRPLVRVEASVALSGAEEGEARLPISVFLQNAETVKVVCSLGGGGWRAVPVTELKKGAKILSSVCQSARHTGIPVEEQILER